MMAYELDRWRFGDFDEYREHVQGWEPQAVQLSCGLLSISFDCLNLSDLVLSRTKCNRDTLLRSVRQEGWYCFAVDLSPKRWCGADIPSCSIRMIAPGHETTAISHQPWDSICVTVRRETLAQWEPTLARLLEWKGAPEHGVCAADRQAVAKFAAWTKRLFSEQWRAGDESALWESALRERLQGHLVAMLGGRPAPTPASSLQRVARYDAAMSACRIIHGELERHLTVRDVASQVGVTIRALEYAFRNVLGITPTQYMLAIRLNLARHQLRRASASGSVTRVAFDHQFENLSRFASQYARLFGERPSETLRQARHSALRA